MLLDNTSDNVAWASAVRGRVNADAHIVNAKAALWRLAGYGLLMIGLGAGLFLALRGYSFIVDKQAVAAAAMIDAEKQASMASAAMMEAFLDKLGRTVLKTEGTVTGTVGLPDHSQVELKPGQEVSLKPSQEVSLKPTTVGINPNSRVRVEGTIESEPRPSLKQLAPEARPPSNAKSMVTNYTVFHEVAMGTGRVVTGWKYNDNEQQEPSGQYCYFSQSSGGLEAAVWLGFDGHFKQPKSSPRGLNLRAAYSNCVWR